VEKATREGGNQGLARTMRRWHDGTGMGLVWQILIFLGGVAPTVLGITGLIMWLRARGWRAEVARRTREKAAEKVVAAE
jgi:hypothetical protein